MALLTNPTQVKNNKLLKLPGEKTLAEAEDQTKQTTSTTSPLLATAMGATPMAAAMAASPAHKNKVVEGAQPERVKTETADVAMAKQQGLKERGGGAVDKLTAQFISDVGTLGSIERQVPAKALEKMNQALIPQAPEITKTVLTKDSPLAKQDPQIKAALESGQQVFIDNKTQALSFGPKVAPTQGMQNGMSTSTGYLGGVPGMADVTMTTAGTYLAEQDVDEQEILGSYDKTGGISQFVAEQVPDQIKMDWLSPEEQAAIQRMGADPSSTQQALQEAARQAQGRMSDVNKARAVVLSNISTMEERAAAQRYLREAGFSGQYTAAETANDLVAQIAQGDTVKFGGQDMRVEDILSNEFIQRKVADWLDTPGLLEAAKKDPSTKALAEYVERNSAAWDKLLEPVKKELDGVKKVRELNKAQASFGDKSQIPPALMDALLPGWQKLTKTGTLNPPPILRTMQMAKNPVEVKALSDLLTNALSVKETKPQQWEKLINMTPAELSKLGLLNGETTWEELETTEALREEARKKVTNNPIETAAVFVGANTVNRVRDTFNKLAQAGIDASKLKDPKYVETLPENIQTQVPAFVKLLERFNPDGTLASGYLATLTGGDFFTGGSDLASVDPEELEILTGTAESYADAIQKIKASETTLATEQTGAVQAWDEAAFKGRQQNWDRAANLIGKNTGGVPLSYAKIQTWANKLPPAEIQAMLSEAKIDPRNPQPIRALLETPNGQYVLEQKIKKTGFGYDWGAVKRMATEDQRFAADIKRLTELRGKLRQHAMYGDTKVQLGAEIEGLQRRIMDAVSNNAVVIGGTKPSKGPVVAGLMPGQPAASTAAYYFLEDAISALKQPASQPPDAPTFTSGGR